jgi:hypothetical protein
MMQSYKKPTMDQTLVHQGVHPCGKPRNAFQSNGIDDKSNVKFVRLKKPNCFGWYE